MSSSLNFWRISLLKVKCSVMALDSWLPRSMITCLGKLSYTKDEEEASHQSNQRTYFQAVQEHKDFERKDASIDIVTEEEQVSPNSLIRSK